MIPVIYATRKVLIKDRQVNQDNIVKVVERAAGADSFTVHEIPQTLRPGNLAYFSSSAALKRLGLVF